MTQENRFKNRIKLNQEILAKIGKIDEFKGLWQGSLRLSPQILGRLKAWVIITSTGASTRIEGAKMTDEEKENFRTISCLDSEWIISVLLGPLYTLTGASLYL